MVLQRSPQRAVIWGYADTLNTPIILTMNNQIYHTRSASSAANALGESIWSVTLDAQIAEGPFLVKITHPLPNGTLVTITLQNILFGDVWLCSGQTNMEFPLYEMFNASREIENADKYPKIRLFTVGRAQSSLPLQDVETIALNWSVASSSTVYNPSVSAVCWLYGRMIQEALGGRPIGLIHSSWSATGIESWSPPEALKQCGFEQYFFI